jgi:MFS family permease
MDMAELAAGQDAPAEFTPGNLKIALACLAGMVVAFSSFVQGAMALLQLPLVQQFHWSRGGIGFALTLMSWASAAAAPFVGRYLDLVGTRRLLIGAAVGISLVTFALSFTGPSILYFYACFVLLGLFGASVIGYSKIIAAVFARHRGKAFAFFTVESTAVAAVMPLLMSAVLGQWGWRAIFVVLAAIKLFVALPILLAWLRDPAEEARARGEAPAATAPDETEGLTLSQTLRTRTFWLIMLANLGGGLTIYGLLPNLVAMAAAQGLGRGAAVWALSFMSLFIALGQFSAGFVLDKVASAKVAAAYLVLFPIGLWLLVGASAATGPLPLLAGMALMGVGGGAQNPMQSYFFTRFFGLKAFAQNTGVFRAIQAVVTGLAPAIVGTIYDRTHGYGPAYGMFFAGAFLSIVVFLLLPRYRFAAGAKAR